MTQQYPYPATPPTKPKPWYKRLWFAATVTLVIGVVIGTASATGSPISTRTRPSSAKAAATVTATATATTTAPAPPARTRTLRPTVVKTIGTRTRTRTVTYTPPPKPAFSDGMYEVGVDIRAGRYRTNGGGEFCYWERDGDLRGGLESIIANDNITGGAIVQLDRGEFFKVSGGCDWRRA